MRHERNGSRLASAASTLGCGVDLHTLRVQASSYTQEAQQGARCVAAAMQVR